MTGLAVALLLLLVAVPLGFLVVRSVLVDGHLSLAGYREALSRSLYYSALLNTLAVGLGAAVLAVAIGTPLAWAVSRTDMPLRETVRAVVNASYLTPPFLMAVAYVSLTAPNTGALNRLFTLFTGAAHGPFNAYTLPTLIFVTGLHTFPGVFLLVSGALESIDSSYEQAARILGTSRWRVTVRITLPLVLPSILTGALLAFVTAIALFGSQAILGIPGRVYTLSTRVYQVLAYPPNYSLASALSMLLVALTLLALTIQRRWLRRRTAAVISGRASTAERSRLGVWRWPLLAYAGFVALAAVVLPYLALLTVSVLDSWPRGLTLANLSAGHYIDVLFRLEAVRRAFANGMLLGVATATVAMVLGIVIAYTTLRTRLAAGQALDYLALVPLGLPGIVLAVAILEFWLSLPVPIYGTLLILLIAYVTRFLPLAVRSASAAIGQIDASLEEAGRIGGRSWAGTLWHVVVPLARPGLLAGWILVFVPSIQELSASVLLFTSETMTLAVAIFNFQENGQLETVCALGIVMMLVASVALYLARRIAGRPIAGMAAA